jgi:FRG domain
MSVDNKDITSVAPSQIPERPFASWEEFKSYVSTDLLPVKSRSDPDPRYLFRGQGDAEWPLVSKFERTFESLPNFDRTAMHEVLWRYFMEECEDFKDYKSVTATEKGFLALAQHHGLPTRLLDWTDSPYIAAYFAFVAHLGKDHGPNKSGKEKNVAIFILDRGVKGYWDGHCGVEVFRPEAWSNDRQKRQSGWFSLAKIPDRTLEDYVHKLGSERSALIKVILSAGLAEHALMDLKLMRINARELFADLDGAATNALVRAVLASSP